MGYLKNELMAQQDNVEAAKLYLREIGVLRECPVHGYIEGGKRDLNESWGLAVAQWRRGKSGSIPWAKGMELRAFTDLLQQAYIDNSGECIGCMQMERE